MSRVLITSTPGAGHVLPMLRLARALRDRGHEVRWAVGPGGADLVARDGFDVVEAGMAERARHAEYVRRFPDRPSGGPEMRVHGFPWMFGAVAAPVMLAEALPFAEEWRPRVVVHDAAELAGPVLAARLGVPSAVHAFGIPIPRYVVASADPVVAPLWRSCGLEPRPYDEADALYLDICPPALDNGERPAVARHQRVRPAEGAPRVPGERPLVYVTFGTVFNNRADLLREVVLGAAASGAEVLLTIGNDGDPAALGELPATVTVERFVPQASVLPRCAAVVSHAGSGTTFGALAHGLPNVLVPQAADQFTNAEQAVAAGAAIAFAGGPPSRDDVAAAVTRVIEDSEFARAAARVAEEIASMPSPGEAAEAVESLVD